MAFDGDTPSSANPNSGGDNADPHVDSDDGSELDEAPDEHISINIAGVSLVDDDDDDEIGDVGDENGAMDFDDAEDPMSVLPLCVLRRVEKLKELHEQRETVLEEYLEDRAALEQKYQSLFAPLYEKRKEIINGTMDNEISADSAKNVDSLDGNITDTGRIDDKGLDDAVGIPQFWVCAMGHMEAIAESIAEEDVDCLEYLTDIKCLDDVDGNGFTLEFHFGPNQYFQNSVLTKRYEVPNLLLADEPILKNVEGCDILWFPKKCLTHREVIKKQRGKGKHAGQIRNLKKQERRDSFFHFFLPPKMPSMESMDEEEADRLEELFDGDYDIAQAFRSHIIPNAVRWFTGQAMDDEMKEMMAMTDFATDGEAPSSCPFPAPTSGDENPECKQN